MNNCKYCEWNNSSNSFKIKLIEDDTEYIKEKEKQLKDRKDKRSVFFPFW